MGADVENFQHAAADLSIRPHPGLPIAVATFATDVASGIRLGRMVGDRCEKCGQVSEFALEFVELPPRGLYLNGGLEEESWVRYRKCDVRCPLSYASPT